MRGISIIVPMHNSSKTIKNCLDSIMTQQYIEEIICIDDASNDDTVSIVDDISHNYNKIILLKNKLNTGTLCTRKKGVESASGKYIMFVDSDDELYPNACSELYETMEMTNVDITRYNTDIKGKTNSNKNNSPHNKPRIKIINDDDLLSLKYESNILPSGWVLWTCIYKADLCKKAFSHLREINILLGEDAYATFYIMYYAKSYCIVENAYYIHAPDVGVSSNCDIDFKMDQYCRAGVLHKDCVNFIKKERKLDRYKILFSQFPIFRMYECIQMLSKVENRVLYQKYRDMIYDAYRYVSDDECCFKKTIVERKIEENENIDYDIIDYIKKILSIMMNNINK